MTDDVDGVVRWMWVWDVIRYIGPRAYALLLAPYRGDGWVDTHSRRAEALRCVI